MTKQKLVGFIELMIRDKNYMINSGKGTTQQKFAWEYSREDLKSVLNFLKKLED